MRIFERWYFGLCWNLRFSYKVMISWRILVSFWSIFWRLYFCMVKYLSFHNSNSFFCLKILLIVNGKAAMWHTPCLFFKFFRVILGWHYYQKKKRWRMSSKQNTFPFRRGKIPLDNREICKVTLALGPPFTPCPIFWSQTLLFLVKFFFIESRMKLNTTLSNAQDSK